MWVVSFTSRPRYPRGKSPGYSLDRRFGWIPEPVWTIWRSKNSWPYRDLNSDLLCCPARNQSLYRLRYKKPSGSIKSWEILQWWATGGFSRTQLHGVSLVIYHAKFRDCKLSGTNNIPILEVRVENMLVEKLKSNILGRYLLVRFSCQLNGNASVIFPVFWKVIQIYGRTHTRDTSIWHLCLFKTS
jgi:hypothetical protein